MKLFGTNGIRGIANDFLNRNNSVKIGMAIASVLGRKNIAMTIDTRISSDMLRSAVSSGIMSVGCNVYNLGDNGHQKVPLRLSGVSGRHPYPQAVDTILAFPRLIRTLANIEGRRTISSFFRS